MKRTIQDVFIYIMHLISTQLFIILLPSLVWGQRSETFSLNFSPEEFELELNDKQQLTVTSNDMNAFFLEDTLAPALPYKVINVLIATNEEYVSYSTDVKDSLIAEDVYLACNPKSYPTDGTNALDNEKDNFHDSTVHANSIIRYTGTHTMDGYKFISLLVCPFSYDKNRKKLYLATELNVQIEVKEYDSKSDETEQHVKMKSELTRNTRSIIQRLSVNGGRINDLYPSAELDETTFTRENSGNYFDYIIVTSNEYKPYFQKLAEWKTMKGVKAKVVTVEDIEMKYSTLWRDTQTKIKLELKYYYDNFNIQYVLLGGDTDIIRQRSCRMIVSGNNQVLPADLYYACFDTMDWDANGNGIYGEVEDSVDLAPEVIISRIPVHNTNEANYFVNRVIEYEKNPIWGQFANSILMSGNTLSGDLLNDSECLGETIYNQTISPYWNGTKVRFYNSITDFPGGANYEYNPTNFQTELAKGYAFVNVISHGNIDTWDMESEEYYDFVYSRVLNNPGYTIFVTNACLTNAFDSTYESLVEAYVSNVNSGILGYYGCSRQGFYSWHSCQLSRSALFIGKFYHSLFSDTNKGFVRAITESKCSLLGTCVQDSSIMRWLQLGMNAIGDPEMPVFTSTPQHFSDVTFQYDNGSLYVNSGIDGCRICIMSRDDIGGSYYKVQNGVSCATFDNLPEISTVCITRPNYLPHIVTIYNTPFIQNEDMSGFNYVVKPGVNIGNNVTTQKPQGPVVIQSGTTEIKNSTGVRIKNCFKVEHGATLRIGN